MVETEIIKIYDDKGHTVLKKRILKHLGIGKGQYLLVELKEDGTAVLKPLEKEDILIRLTKPEMEDLVLEERNTLRYKLYQTKQAK